ncbi:MAG: Ni/Fe hydrogenase subunit gamma [Candidatus Nitrosothermus koennekii]|nr:MAG: Ni/Fe hydrogenase subunit gamma [Candidatus Nitrosothermus koennekii]
MYNPFIPKLVKIRKIKKETYDTYTITIETKDFRFLPGQFNMIYVFGTGEVPISISSNPYEDDIIMHTVRKVGNVTNAICRLKPNNIIGIRGPYGNPWPIEEHKGNDILIIAGGLGLAPLRPLIYYLLANREKYGKITLLYGAKTPQDLLYKKELEKWNNKVDVMVTVDKAKHDWTGNVGVVTTLIPKIDIEPFHTSAFICGPEIMMYFVAKELIERNINTNNIFVSMERNMKCAIGFCGHCQLGPEFICKDGPVFNYNKIGRFLKIKEV